MENYNRNDLLKKITDKHNEQVKNQENTEFLYSRESLELAFSEIEKIKQILKDFVLSLNESASSYHVQARDNNRNVCDIIFNTNMLLVQFYQAYGNMAKDSYLLFGTVEGLFDANGHADPFYPPKNRKIMRLDFSKNNDGQLGWRDRENKDTFYSTEEIVDLWLNEFFSEIK